LLLFFRKEESSFLKKRSKKVIAHPGFGIAFGARASAMACRTVFPVCLAVLATVRNAA
jgi:hypothetical protein